MSFQNLGVDVSNLIRSKRRVSGVETEETVCPIMRVGTSKSGQNREPLFLSPLHSLILPGEEAVDRDGLAATYEDTFSRSFDFLDTHNDYGEWAQAITSAGFGTIGSVYEDLSQWLKV